MTVLSKEIIKERMIDLWVTHVINHTDKAFRSISITESERNSFLDFENSLDKWNKQ